jgi:diaminohydroxyphosphoribosylaminopyrimidine deaminase/5-amino-6-(5-phosphoribosylamino)uracil reductase
VSRRVEDNQFPTHRADELMQRAIGLTEATRPHPNPRVGAVVLSPAGQVVAERAHLAAGTPHAEAAALADAGSQAAGSTLVVTLEPCSHYGRTPPCVDAIVDAGVSRVVVGAVDPDPRVAGKGIERIRAAGIEVVVGVEDEAVRRNDPAYFHHRSTGRPLVTLKIAMTLDGQSAAADRTSQWITGPAARRDAHELRSENDAVLVGNGTVLADDPRLDVRLDGYSGPQPRPVVVSGRRAVPSTAKLFERNPIVFASDAVAASQTDGVDVIVLPGGDGVDLSGVVAHLGNEGLLSVLVEGGPRIAGGALRSGIVDRIVLYFGAKLAVGVGLPAIAGTLETISDAHDVSITKITRLGSDVRIDATIERGV